jgi:c-di-GMP-related signal transduction protein
MSVVRIPVMDMWNHVHGYELLFWDAGTGKSESDGAMDTHPNQVCAQIEVEIVSRSLPAFVHCTSRSLNEEWVRWLPTCVTVLELEGNDEPTEEQVATLAELKTTGYRIALRGVAPYSSPLWKLADYVKVDAARIWESERRELLERIKENRALAIAINVDTECEFHKRQDEGFEFFQGSYLFRPEPMPVHQIPANRMVHMEILEVLQKSPVDLGRLSQLIKCDASLTFRLLRVVNSPLCALRQEVTSIMSALLLLGEDAARRFATLTLAVEFNTDQPMEILRVAMQRARFCEQCATLCGQIASEQYLIGLVSMFPAMLRTNMEDVVKLLPLRDQATAALLGRQSPESVLLEWIVSHELGEWERCEKILESASLNREQIVQRYSEAAAWADLVLFNVG